MFLEMIRVFEKTVKFMFIILTALLTTNILRHDYVKPITVAWLLFATNDVLLNDA